MAAARAPRGLRGRAAGAALLRGRWSRCTPCSRAHGSGAPRSRTWAGRCPAPQGARRGTRRGREPRPRSGSTRRWSASSASQGRAWPGRSRRGPRPMRCARWRTRRCTHASRSSCGRSWPGTTGSARALGICPSPRSSPSQRCGRGWRPCPSHCSIRRAARPRGSCRCARTAPPCASPRGPCTPPPGTRARRCSAPARWRPS
mmetsp:Transcript_7324/g.18729  ORF Transcript_7324/g.18729 Transcript_7324/m.18729 type:complete len:202 (+) Transcript_7324:297-902(+)